MGDFKTHNLNGPEELTKWLNNNMYGWQNLRDSRKFRDIGTHAGQILPLILATSEYRKGDCSLGPWLPKLRKLFNRKFFSHQTGTPEYHILGVKSDSETNLALPIQPPQDCKEAALVLWKQREIIRHLF